MKLFAKHFAILSLLMFFAVLSAQSQTGTTSVSGTVFDSNGNTVPNATVTISAITTNFTRSSSTKENGTFTFTSLSPDIYKIEVEANGFKKSVLTDVKAVVDTPLSVNISLEVGNVSEIVTVQSSGTEISLNTQDATIGNTITSRQITDLPLEARSPISLLTLQPGVTKEGYVTGARSDQSNITLDGIDVNDPEYNSITSPAVRLIGDAVEEFRVVTSNPNANQGRSSGAQISLVTKGGTNDYHGTLNWTHRNTIFTANNFFSNAAGRYVETDSNVINGFNKVGDERTPRPRLLRNTFGGSFGGKIIEDRAFFFFAYEGRRDASETGYTRSVPLANLGQGIIRFPDASGSTVNLSAAEFASIYSAAGLNPNVVSLFNEVASKYQANLAGDGYNVGNYRFNVKTPVNLNNYVLRLDFNLTRNGNHQLSLRGNYQQDSSNGARMFPDTPAVSTWNHPTGFVAAHTWTISNNLINVARYGITRSAYSQTGDSADNSVNFRFIYQPFSYTRTFDQTIPLQNITDDLTWIKGDHTFQFGTNIRIVSNNRTSFSSSFDSAIINNQYYLGSGSSLLEPLADAGYTWQSGYANNLQAAVASLIGRFSQYTANYNYDLEGNPIASGEGIKRIFASEEYDIYFQDIWRIKPNLTLTAGLRYGLSRPVYEKQGYMATSTIPLGEFLERRLESAANGQNYTEQVIVDLAGSKYGKPGFYPLDKNNFQPRFGISWTPRFETGFWRKVFGGNSESVIRGGFSITNDYFGQALAVAFNANNSLGFSSSYTNNANSFNVTDNLAPLYSGTNFDVRSFPGAAATGTLTFPQIHANGQAIEQSLDSNLVSPIQYQWNVSYGRTLPFGLTIEASYIGRAGRNLLLGRDVMSPNLSFTDPTSGMTYTEASRLLEDARIAGTSTASITPIPFFENLYSKSDIENIFGPLPSSWSTTSGVYYLLQAVGRDYTYMQEILDSYTGKPYFYHPQYGALAVYSTIGSADYHGGTLSVRQRFGSGLILDFNYTLSKSMDDASGLQSASSYSTGSFIVNPSDLKQQRSVSDFDTRHVINANALWDIPVGKGRQFLGNIPSFLDAVIGGWRLGSVFRWNSGLPLSAPLDYSGWASNYNRRNFMVRLTDIETSPNRGINGELPTLFSDTVATWQSFRNSVPGESGDRNILRFPGYITLDLGIHKKFSMPWNETHKLEFRMDAFNITNTQRFTGVGNWYQTIDPFNDTEASDVPPSFGQFTGIQGNPRVVQLGLRFVF